MKVVLVLEDLSIGGAQAHAAELALRLPPDGWTTEVLVLGARVAPVHAARLGPAVHALGQQGLRRPAEWRRLGRAIAARRPDLVVSVNQVAGCVVAAARLHRWLRAPAVSILHTTRVANWAGRLRTTPYLAAAHAHASVVFVSERQRAFWARRGLGGRRTRVIRNGVDLRRHPLLSPAERATAKAALGLDPSALVLGSAAMFRPEKNHAQMLAALAALRADGVAAELILVGDGPTRQAAAAQVRTLGLEGAVRFYGEQGDVRPFLAAMDAGVLCSTSIETLPLFGLELMAGGAPLVASRIGGLEELVEDGRDGLLFPPGDTAGLVRQLKRCADPAGRARLSQAAGRKAQGFTVEAMTEGYSRLFKTVAEGALERA